jgi:hypothetical protein
VEQKFVPKPNTGSLFKINVKSNENSPDMKGDIFIDTKTLDIDSDGMAVVKLSGWKSVSKTSGKSYLSLKVDQWVPTSVPKFQPKQEEQDDDIPF